MSSLLASIIVILSCCFAVDAYYGGTEQPAFPTPKPCEFEHIIMYTESATYQWFNCSAGIFINPHKEDQQSYSLEVSDFVEKDAQGNEVVRLSSFLEGNPTEYGDASGYGNYYSAMPPKAADTSVMTLYDITLQDVKLNGKKIGQQLNFTLPGVFSISYSLYNRSKVFGYGPEIITLTKGSLKFDLSFASWPFRNTSNVLEGLFNLTSSAPMVNCVIDSNPEEGEFYEKFACEGERSDFAELFPNFGLVNDRQEKLDITFRLVNQTKFDGSLFDDSDSVEEESKCGGKRIGQIQHTIFAIQMDYFTGEFFYDPEISVLLGGARGDSDCSDDVEMNWIIWILSCSFAGACCLFILFVMLLSECKYPRQVILGQEGTRIKRIRLARGKKREPASPLTSVL
uniref:Uncharacterized protein n=1 Tax=Vannella robusta TaxID=1487602 RepID=A0A7S4M9F2_9EUKA|mmetsp:Transcript_15839/g.20152  ORF Transcript_15839/g.20152 Transcript_15839/m.20152 type:complete len:398 (+) Transcript_15839:25-1218(+)